MMRLSSYFGPRCCRNFRNWSHSRGVGLTRRYVTVLTARAEKFWSGRRNGRTVVRGWDWGILPLRRFNPICDDPWRITGRPFARWVVDGVEINLTNVGIVVSGTHHLIDGDLHLVTNSISVEIEFNSLAKRRNGLISQTDAKVIILAENPVSHSDECVVPSMMANVAEQSNLGVTQVLGRGHVFSAARHQGVERQPRP
jgi:hypothetical protein